MNARILLPSLLLAASLSACATGSGPHPSYGQELDRLTADCRERGGILSPISGAQTGRPQTDFTCEIRGGPSRLTRN